MGTVTGVVLTSITDTVNQSAASAAAAAAAAQGFTGGVPAGVVLGVRFVGVAGNGDLVMGPALGAFGSVIGRFLAAAPPATPSTSKCPMNMIATVALCATSLPILRGLRDGRLARSEAGRELIALYYRHAPEVSAILMRHPTLLARASRLSATVCARLESSGAIPPESVQSGLVLAHDLASHGTQSLRRDLARAHRLAASPTVWA